MCLKLVSILASFLILQSSFIVQKVGRDLSTYDQAGPYELNNDLHPHDADKILGEIRGFLWEHWKERRPGVVNDTFFSIEGDQPTSSFLVEPDAKSSWRISVESVSIISALLPKRRKPRREITHEFYDEIERLEATSENAPPSVPIPSHSIRQPQTYRIRFRNSRTNAIRLF